MSLRRWLILSGIMLGLFAAWYGGKWAMDALVQRNLRQAQARVAAAEQALDQARQSAASELSQARSEMLRWRQEADRRGQQNQRLLAERQALLARLNATAATIDQIREEAAHVPASELLIRLRHALVALRQPIAGGGTTPDGR